MRLRNRLVVLIVPLTLTLTGCFQQAGTALQEPIPSSQAAVSVPATSIPLPTEANTTNSGAGTGSTDNSGQVQDAPTATLVENVGTVTLDSGGQANSNIANPPVALTIISATRPPQMTAIPVSDVPTEASGGTGDAQGTPVEGQFITPGSPLGPVTQVPVLVSTNGVVPTATPSGLVTPTAIANVETINGCTHTVQSGDTLYRIAVKYDISVAQLRAANTQVTGDIIQPGDELTVPGCTATGNGSGGSSAGQATVEPTTPATTLPSGSQTYVVKRGDTLYTISLQFGVSMDAIQQANNLSNPNRINPGQELVIPAKSG